LPPSSWADSTRFDVFLFFDVGSSYHCEVELANYFRQFL